MSDAQTTIGQLRQQVAEFVTRRDWQQFHSPKNLAMSLAIEAAELMEHFQWLTPEQSRSLAGDDRRLQSVSEEMADVLCYLLAMANQLGVDLAAAVERKMALNEQKYPADDFRGRFGPDDPSLGNR